MNGARARAHALAFLVVAALASTTPAAAGAAARSAAPAGSEPVSVALDRTRIDTSAGARFTFRSVVRNTTGRTLPGLIAHLNVLSRDPGVYVDPEDWSEERTRYLAPLAPRDAVTVPWSVQAVNAGRFALYVTVYDQQAARPLPASPPLELSAAAERTLNAGGVLPVAAAVPSLVLLLLVLTRVRRRRLR